MPVHRKARCRRSSRTATRNRVWSSSARSAPAHEPPSWREPAIAAEALAGKHLRHAAPAASTTRERLRRRRAVHEGRCEQCQFALAARLGRRQPTADRSAKPPPMRARKAAERASGVCDVRFPPRSQATAKPRPPPSGLPSTPPPPRRRATARSAQCESIISPARPCRESTPPSRLLALRRGSRCPEIHDHDEMSLPSCRCWASATVKP